MVDPTTSFTDQPLVQLDTTERLSQLVGMIGLSARTANCFGEEGIATLGDLVKRTERELLRLPNFGQTSLWEVVQRLSQMGLSLAKHTPLSQRSTKFFPSVGNKPLSVGFRTLNHLQSVGIRTLEDLVSRTEAELLEIPNFGQTSLREITRSLSKIGLSLADEPLVSPDKLDKADWALEPVSNFVWSVRTANCFEQAGIVTLGDLVKRTKAELLLLPNFGRTSLHGVVQRLSLMGLSFADEPLEQQTSLIPIVLEENPIKVEEYIIQDLEQYVSVLESRRKTIFCMRYGFGQPVKTLEDVGKNLGLTRERIRQIHSKLQKNLAVMGTVNKKDLSLYLQHRSGTSLHELFPKLDSLFIDAPPIKTLKSIKSIKNDYLIEFLEDYTGVERGTYQVAEKLMSEISLGAVKHIFLEVPSPISLELFKQELQSLYGLPESSLDHAVNYLKDSKKCRITEKGIVPENMSHCDCVTHVLLHFPNGCHWRTIKRLLEHLKISTPSKSRGPYRPDSSIQSNDHVYLYGSGIYRHVKFLNLDTSNIKDILKATIRIIKTMPRNSGGLKEMYLDIINQLKFQISFYDLRYVLKEYGSRQGIYFDGKSGTHTLALQKVQERITNKKVILNVFRKQNKALRIEEIKIHLQGHISTQTITLLIGECLDSNVLVRVDPSTYCLPDIAFSKIDRATISNKVHEYLSHYELIEHDFLRERLNAEFNQSYSKYFYNSFVKYCAEGRGWYHSIDLVSAKKLEFRRTVDALKDYLKSKETFKADCEFLLNFYGVSGLTLSRYAMNHLRD